MTTLQKVLATVTVAALMSAAIYESRQAAQLRRQIETVRQQQAPLVAQIQELTRERDAATNQLAAQGGQKNNDELLRLRNEVTQLRARTNELAKAKDESTGTETKSQADAAESLLDRVRLLKERLAQTPDARIPELQYLTEEDWVRAAAEPKQLMSDEDFRSAFTDLRNRAEGNFLSMTEPALRKYIEANNNEFPTDLSQLKSYFTNSPGDEIFQRYQIVPGSSMPVANSIGDAGDWLITLKGPPDGGSLVLGRNGVAVFDNSDPMNILAPAMKALSDDTPVVNGRKQMDIRQLGPYLKTPEQKAAYQRLLGNK